MGEDFTLGFFSFIFGFVFCGFALYYTIHNIINGVRELNGKIIGFDPDTRAIHIRYKIKRGVYHEVSCPYINPYFTVGKPHLGLKVIMNVRRDDPYKVVSIVAGLRMHRTSAHAQETYADTTKTKKVILLCALTIIPILIGILFMSGVMST